MEPGVIVDVAVSGCFGHFGHFENLEGLIFKLFPREHFGNFDRWGVPRGHFDPRGGLVSMLLRSW